MFALGASLLGNLLTSEGIMTEDFLMLPHPLTNLEIQKYYQNEPKYIYVQKIICLK